MPLHRSLLFWFGLFILSFLVWAWADSRKSEWSYRWYPPGYRSTWELSSGGSTIVLDCARFFPKEQREYDFRAVESRLRGGARYAVEPKGLPVKPWFPRLAADHRVDETELVAGRFGVELFESEVWRLAWWVLVVGYLPLWLGVAMWRARRIARGRSKVLGRPGSGYVRVVVR